MAANYYIILFVVSVLVIWLIIYTVLQGRDKWGFLPHLQKKNLLSFDMHLEWHDLGLLLADSTDATECSSGWVFSAIFALHQQMAWFLFAHHLNPLAENKSPKTVSFA